MILNGEVIQEDSLEGVFTFEESLDGDISSEQSLNGEVIQEDSLDGDISSEQSLEGELFQEDFLEGVLTFEESLDGDISSEQSLEGEVQPFARQTSYSHPDLVNRDIPDQHPQNAITNLAEDMAARPKDIITDSEIWNL